MSPIYQGGNKIDPLYVGGQKIAEVYAGSTKVYSSTPPGGVVFVDDTFTDSNGTVLSSHTPDIGGAWSQHDEGFSSDLIITNNRVHGDGGNSHYYNATEASGDNVSGEWTVHLRTNGVSSNRSGIWLRWLGTLNGTGGYVIWADDDSGNNTLNVGDGFNSTGGSIAQVGVTIAEGDLIRAEIVGTSIKVWQNGNLRIDTTDGSYSGSGQRKVGAMAGGSNNDNNNGWHNDHATYEDL